MFVVSQFTPCNIGKNGESGGIKKAFTLEEMKKNGSSLKGDYFTTTSFPLNAIPIRITAFTPALCISVSYCFSRI